MIANCQRKFDFDARIARDETDRMLNFVYRVFLFWFSSDQERDTQIKRMIILSLDCFTSLSIFIIVFLSSFSFFSILLRQFTSEHLKHLDSIDICAWVLMNAQTFIEQIRFCSGGGGGVGFAIP